jgi:hypothetical protein
MHVPHWSVYDDYKPIIVFHTFPSFQVSNPIFPPSLFLLMQQTRSNIIEQRKNKFIEGEEERR